MTPLRELLAALRDAIALAVFVGFILLVTPSRGHAAILSEHARESGGEALLLVAGCIIGLAVGYATGWLKYARRVRITAPHDDAEHGAFDYRRMGQ